MNNIKPFIIFRKDGFYNSLYDLLSIIKLPEESEINIIVSTEEHLEEINKSINSPDFPFKYIFRFHLKWKHLRMTERHTKQRIYIYENIDVGETALIIDMYYKFDKEIQINDYTNTKAFLIKTPDKMVSIPYLISFQKTKQSNVGHIHDIFYIDTNKKNFDNITIHDNFLNLLKLENDFNSMLIRNSYIDTIPELIFPQVYDNLPDNKNYYKKLYKLAVLVHPQTENANDYIYKYLLEIYNNYPNYLSTYYYIIDNIDNEILFKDGFFSKLITKPFIQSHIIISQNYCIEKSIMKKLGEFYVNNLNRYLIPNWISLKYIDKKTRDKLLPSIVKSKKILKSLNNLVVDYQKYNIGNYTIEYNEGFQFFDVKYDTFVPIIYNDKLLVINSTCPLIVSVVKGDKLVNLINTHKNLKYTGLFGTIVLFMKYFIGLIKIKENCFKFVLLDSKNFDIKGYSNCFQIKNPIDLVSRNDKLFIITKQSNEMYIENEIDLVTYFNDIMQIHNIDKNYKINIKYKNNIQLTIENYDNILSFSNGYNFNKQDEEYCGKASYDYNLRLIRYNNNIVYYNKFIYLPKNITNIVKEFDVYFYKENELYNELKSKIIEYGLTISDKYQTAKYCFITHSYLENMNSFELSDIIEHNSIIISLITEDEINKNNFNYTSNQFLTKLYLFNIAINNTYVEFIIQNILMEEQYEKRTEFMYIDKDNMFDKCNIYKQIIKLKKNGFSKKIKSNNLELTAKIGTKLFDTKIQYNNLVNYFVNNHFDLEMRYYKCNIPQKYMKLNFLGNISDFEIDNSFDILFINKYEDIHIISGIFNNSDDKIIFIIESNQYLLV
jgi:hypothetical protein